MRNLGLMIALCLAAFAPASSLALGLGEIEVKSFLNQPLNAEIEVMSARPGEVDDLLVSLASREAFTRAGLSRPRHLVDLRFAVQKDEDGNNAVILVTTRNAVKEPFLNFLVEADWSKGRLLREFTILLDPPFYANQPPPVEPAPEPAAPETSGSTAMEQPIAQAEPEPQPSATDDSISQPIALSTDSGETMQAETSMQEESPPASSPPSESEYVAQDSLNIIGGDVSVVKGDTLWSIASQYYDGSYSMSQIMLAFQRANPDAFSDGNINNMKVGAVLRAPSQSDLAALGQQAAYAEVLTQNGLWDEYVARVTGVAPAMNTGDGGDDSGMAADDGSSGELSLLVPGEGDSDSAGSGDSADLEQLRTKLALAEEELEASRIENKDLESRIAELQARVTKFEELQKMIEIEDDSLAQLQADQAAENVEDATPAPADDDTVTTDLVTGSIESDEEALLEELLAEEAAAQAEEQAQQQLGGTQDSMSDDDAMSQDEAMSDETMSDDAMSDDTMADDMSDDGAVAGADTDTMSDDEAAPAPTIAPPAPVIITESASSSTSLLDEYLPSGLGDMIPSMSFLADPIILGAVGGVVVLLLVLLLVKRRKAAQEDELGLGGGGDTDLFASDDEEEMTPIHLTESDDPVQTDINVPTDDFLGEDEPTRAATDFDVDDVDDEFQATAIVSAVDMPEPEGEAPAAVSAEQDDVLNEVDVYLAYGLYDNAEELLKSSLAENPQRGDYRSKLLDTYFATKNADAFVQEAETLKGMGDAANPYWDRVQIMGYELAPDNALFSDAKDSGMSAADLEIAKPQEADFDLGSSDEDDTNFSSTDFNLGEEDGDLAEGAGEAGELESTQQVSGPDDAATDGGDDLPDLPDDIGSELEFSMDDDLDLPDESAGEELQLPDEVAGDDLQLPDDDFDLPDDLDVAAEEPSPTPEAADDDLSMDFDMDEDVGDALEIDDASDLETPGETPDFSNEPTAVMDFQAADEIETPEAVTDESSPVDDDLSEIDLGMEDTGLTDVVDASELELDAPSDDNLADLAEMTGELQLDDDDDGEDISIIDFGGEDFVEPTQLVSSIDEEDIAADDDFVIDEEDEDEIRTGTFAPGDFDEPTEAVQSLDNMDDMDDLMLPDDVDEVSTKLDLARAFIDMGDNEGARGSLEEVMAEGNAEQKEEARALLDQI